MSSELRAQILANAPLENTQSENLQGEDLPEEQVEFRPRWNKNKVRFLVGATALGGVLLLVIAPTQFHTVENARRSSVPIAMPPSVLSNRAQQDSLRGSAERPSSFSNSPNAASPVNSSALEPESSREMTSTLANPTDERVTGKDLKSAPIDELSQAKDAVGVPGINIYGTDGDDMGGSVPVQRAVHREGSVAVAVQNAEVASDKTEAIIKNVGGFIANNALSTGANQTLQATLDCRIPVDKFEVAVQKISQLGKVRAKSINGEDVTARVAHLTARKNSLSRELSISQAQLIKKEKSARKSDEQSLYYQRMEVRQLRVQAAQARANLETLRRYSDLSSLYVTLSDQKSVTPVPAAGWTSSIGQTFNEAWQSFARSAQFPVQILIWIAAYTPFWLPLLLIWRKYGRKWLAQ